eukprot:1411637-Rhodomonas_salina.1
MAFERSESRSSALQPHTTRHVRTQKKTRNRTSRTTDSATSLDCVQTTRTGAADLCWGRSLGAYGDKDLAKGVSGVPTGCCAGG